MASTTDDPVSHSGAPAEIVRIRYHRPPDRTDVFTQDVVHVEPGVHVTYLERTPPRKPVVVDGRTVLEHGSPIVWFTFPGSWHDIGRFHSADGTFTGLYANILTPVEFHDPVIWETTDLFLDIWVWPDGRARVLDAQDLAEAVRNGWIAPDVARKSRAEAARILRSARQGDWPPSPVRRWTLERVRRELDRKRRAWD